MVAKKVKKPVKLVKTNKKRTKGDPSPKSRVLEDAKYIDPVNVETLVSCINLEPVEPVEEVQFTETSYTSASLETLPPSPTTIIKSKKKKRKKVHVEVESVQIEKSDRSIWSDESQEIPQITPKPVEDEKPQKTVEGKRKGKGKGKGKKKKKEKEKKQGDVPDFEKPKKWKKMNLKQRAEWLAARTEQWKIEVENEKQAQLANAKEKKLNLERQRKEIMEKETKEQDCRRDILVKICNLFQRYENHKTEDESIIHSKLEWQQYLRCDGLPDALKVQELNSYLTTWRENLLCTDEDLSTKFGDVFPMLELIDIFTFNSKKYTPRQKLYFAEVRLALLNQLRQAIECTCFQLLLDLENTLKFKPVTLATYDRKFNRLNLHIWVAVKLPTRKKIEEDAESQKENTHLSFSELGLELTLPHIIDTSDISVKVAQMETDLYSENTRTYSLLEEKPNQYEDLFTYNVKEYEAIKSIKGEYDEIRKKFYSEINHRMKELEKTIKSNPYLKFDKEKEELEILTLAEPPPLLGGQNPREKITFEKEIALKNYLISCNLRIKIGEINLRKYRMCGGVISIHLIKTPLQSKYMRGDVILRTFVLPKELKIVPYEVRYRPLAPPAEDNRTPEQILEDNQRTKEELDKLVMIQMQLPTDVLWLQPPVVCQWNEEKQFWTTKFICDFHYDELNNDMQFRTGILWPIGLANLRYSNLPFQDWSMGPEESGSGVLITLTGVHVTLTFSCRGRNVTLKEVTNIKSSVLDRLIDKQMTVRRMLLALREIGCDVFPDFDAYNYVEGSCPKEWVMERHNYHAMAFLSRAYSFKWSKWNKQADQRNIVLQMKEARDKRVTRYQLLLVTPQRASVLKNNEMMAKYSDEVAPDIEFYPDLFSLNMNYGSTEAKKSPFNMKHILTETVFEFLVELKLCSFS